MKKTEGFFWHVHHDVLVDYCYDYERRVAFIGLNKSKNEIPTRLRLFQSVKGKLPLKLIAAGAAFCRAHNAYIKIREEYFQTQESCQKLGLNLFSLACDCEKARDVCDKAIKKHHAAIEALHAKECPNCPWNGDEIVFPEEGEK